MNVLDAIDWKRKRRRAERVTWIGGALMGISIVGSVAYSTFEMQRAFEAMGNSGIGDPDALARHIGEVLVASAIGIIVFLAGLLGVIAGLVGFFRLRKAERQAGHGNENDLVDREL